MTRIILSGCFGKMGRVIADIAKTRNDIMIAAGCDISSGNTCAYPVFEKIGQINCEADVIIDFSHPSNLNALLEYAKSNNMPLVLATTGFSKEQTEQIKAASAQIPLFFSFNMSLGINLLISLCQKAAAVLGNEFDIEIIEKHHNQKIDAPSGTAIMLADAVNQTLDHTMSYMYDRHSRRLKRDSREIGIHSVRGGTIVGEHEVIFSGRDEIISLSHSARSKEVFAAGAVNAALFMKNREKGLYDMSDLVKY